MNFNSFVRKHITDQEFEEWVRLRQPYVATFELTPKCNFRCIHCYLGVHREEDTHLSYEQVINILDKLEHAGVLHLALTGGECTLREDFCDIYKYAKEKGFLVTVFTNASYITSSMIDIFKKYPPFTLEISLYGGSESIYEKITLSKAFNKVICNLQALYANDINFVLKTPLMVQNQSDKEHMEQIARSFGKELVVGYVMSPTIDKELYPSDLSLGLVPRFLQEVKSSIGKAIGFKEADIENPWGAKKDRGEFVPQYICNPGVNDVFIDYTGKVCPCVAFRNIGVSLLDNDFCHIWDEFSYLKQIPATQNNKCIYCESRFFCSICVGDQLNVFGDIDRVPWDVCAYAKARKMYYKDKINIDIIIRFLEKEEFKYGVR